MVRMVAYFGFKRDTEVVVDVLPLECGAGYIICTECGGTGDWPWHPSGVVEDCVPCKGQGRMYISI